MIARRTILGTLLGMTALATLGGTASAQQWPARPVKIIVTFPPGGASDAAARVISGPLSEKLGQSVVVDNKPGGGTTIGANAVLAAKDDSHADAVEQRADLDRALPVRQAALRSAQGFRARLLYRLGRQRLRRAAGRAGQGHEGADRLDQRRRASRCRSARAARARSATSSARCSRPSSGSAWSTSAIAGPAPMFQDMMAGQLDFAVVTLTEVLPLAKDGKLRMLALTSTQKAPLGARRAAGDGARLSQAGGGELRRPLRAGGHSRPARRRSCTRRWPRCWPIRRSSSGWAISGS